MKIAIGSDHGGFELKKAILAKYTDADFLDFGPETADSCDYPDYAAPAARAVAEGRCDRGVLVCTTGVGMSVTANKIPGIRCALLSDLMSARLTREHNDSNIVALGQGVVGEKLALEIVDTFLATPFSNGDRHIRRIAKLTALEQK